MGHGFDFLAIDREHTTISLEQAQGIIAASQSFGVPCLPPYVASKFGVTGLTQSLAKELGPVGIRINAVCPVLVNTPGLTSTLNLNSSSTEGNAENFLDDFAKNQTTLGFLPTATDAAELCHFLSGSGASAITGQSINVGCGVLPN